MKKTISAGLIALLMMILCCGFVSFAGESAADGPPVHMEVSSIYGNIGKVGVHVPLSVRLYGQSGAGFEGYLAVRTLETESDEGEEIYEYRYPVTVDMAETKDVELYVPLGQRSRQMHVVLFDADGREIASRTMTFETPEDTGQIMIGALTDRMEEIAYLDNVSMNYGMVRSKLIQMDAETFPEDIRGMELLDIVVINHFETDRLSDGQMETLRAWVDEGGTLLIGTGAMVYSTLGAGADALVELPIGAVSYEKINLGIEYAENRPGDSDIEMICADLEIPGGRVVQESDGIPLLTMVGRGEGQVGVYSYDLGEVLEFTEKNPNYVIQMFHDVLGEDEISQYYYASYGNEQEYWNAYSLVGSGNSERMPNLAMYTLVIIGYVLLAGPGLYLWLKKKDASLFYGTAVTLTAMAVSAVIYLLGMSTRFTSQFFTVASILEMDGSTTKETAYLNVRTPDSRRFSAAIPAGYDLVPLTRSSRYDEQPIAAFDIHDEEGVAIAFGEDGDGTVLYAKESQAFEPRFFRATKYDDASGGLVHGEVQYFDGRISGTVMNGMEQPLYHAALVVYGQLYVLGDLAAGEVRAFEQEAMMAWPAGVPYMVADYLMQAGRSDEEDGHPEAGGIETLYSHYIGEQFYDYTDEAFLIAYGEAGGIAAAEEMSGQDCDDRVLYAASIAISNEQNGRIYRSGLMHSPEVNSGSGAVYGDGLTMYGNDPVTVEYALGTDIEIEKLSFVPVSREFLEHSDYYYLKVFDGEAAFYNRQSGDYDRVDLTRIDFTAEELDPYLTKNHHIVVKYTASPGDDAGNSLLLPHLMVTGRAN